MESTPPLDSHSDQGRKGAETRRSPRWRRSWSRSRSRSSHYRPRSTRRDRRHYSRSPPSPRRYGYRSERSSYRRPRYAEPAPPSEVLGVFGLGTSTTKQDLDEIYSKFGKVNDITLIKDRRTDQSKGYGFIYFDSVDEARKALEETRGLEIDGREIRVDFSRTKRPHSPTPGRYAGARGRDSYRHSRKYSPSPRRTRMARYSRSVTRSRSYSR